MAVRTRSSRPFPRRAVRRPCILHAQGKGRHLLQKRPPHDEACLPILPENGKNRVRSGFRLRAEGSDSFEAASRRVARRHRKGAGRNRPIVATRETRLCVHPGWGHDGSAACRHSVIAAQGHGLAQRSDQRRPTEDVRRHIRSAGPGHRRRALRLHSPRPPEDDVRRRVPCG